MQRQSSRRGHRAWLLQGVELLRGEIIGQDDRLNTLTIETDGGSTLTLPQNVFVFEPRDAHKLLDRAMARLAQARAELDREGAMFVPVTIKGEKYCGCDI